MDICVNQDVVPCCTTKPPVMSGPGRFELREHMSLSRHPRAAVRKKVQNDGARDAVAVGV